MFKMLRNASVLGGLAAFARSSAGQKAIAKAKAYATSPETRRKLGELKNKAMKSRTG